MFLYYCSVLYNEHTRISAHNGFERHGIDGAENVHIYLVVHTEFFYFRFAGAGQNVA